MVVSRETGPAEPVANWAPSMATEDVGFFGPAGRSLHGVQAAALCCWILGVTDPGRARLPRASLTVTASPTWPGQSRTGPAHAVLSFCPGSGIVDG